LYYAVYEAAVDYQIGKKRIHAGVMLITNKDTEYRLQMGDICFSLRFEDPGYCSFAREHYQEFLSENDPDINVTIKIALHQEAIKIPGSFLMSKTVENNNFSFHSDLINGSVDLDKKQCSINVKNELLSGKRIRYFEQFLCQVYYTLLKHNQRNIINNFVIHGCAIRRNGAGYLFTGRSGSGKSTIAKLSSDFDVLNDELVILKKVKGSYTLCSTPFQGDFKGNSAISVPLNAVFLIKHGKRNNIKQISKAEFVTRFIKEVIYSQSLLSTKNEDVLLEMMDFCADVAVNVPFYEMKFLPDKSFWDVIDGLNGLNNKMEVEHVVVK